MYQFNEGNKLLDADLVLAKAQVGGKMRVADFGCGSTGHFVFPAARLVGKDGQVYAIDILKAALETIKRRIKIENAANVIPLWSDIEIFGATGIEANSIDVVLLMNTLHLSKKRADILREANRVLKKNGKLVIVDWKNIASPFGPPPEDRVNLENLKIAAEKLGFKFDEEFFAGHFHFGLIFVKF
jgi:ubiquinone/menaquinone biosynthesis C-methylase UbiE